MSLIKVSPEMQTVPFRKNVIINGGMDIWQRGTSFVGAANGSFTTDRFKFGLSNSGVWDLTRSTNVPTVAQSGRKFNYSYRADVTTADGTVGSTDLCRLIYRIEGYDYQSLYQQDQTLSFWIKGNKTGIYCVAFRNTGSDRSYVSEITINSADTWEKKTITITTAPSAGTWNFTNGMGLEISFSFVSGTFFQTTKDAWQSGNFLATSNQVNLADSTSNYIQITGVQLEKGTTATEFEYRSIGEELALCQRYYEKSYNMDVDPGTSTDLGAESHRYKVAVSLEKVAYAVSKKGMPSVTVYSTTGAANNVRNNSASTDIGVGSIGRNGESGFILNLSGGTTVDNFLTYNWTAQSEL